MTVRQLLTAEQLWEMPETPGKRYELVRGELIEMPGAGGEHGFLALWVGSFLLRFVLEHDLGVVGGDGTGYLIYREPDVLRIPDVSFVSKGRISEGGVPKGFWPLAPDLAVEIVSPNDTAAELHAKVREYLDAGARMVWVFWPDERGVSVHGPTGEARELGPDDELDGGNVLPGFRVRVSELFRVV